MAFSVRRAFEARDQCVLTVTLRTRGSVLPRLTAETLAVVDTGSEVTVVGADLARTLRLDVTGSVEMTRPLHPDPVECFTTFAEIVMHGEDRRIWVIPQPLVVAPGHVLPGLILGMDALRDGRLTIHFPNRWWSFAVPAGEA